MSAPRNRLLLRVVDRTGPRPVTRELGVSVDQHHTVADLVQALSGLDGTGPPARSQRVEVVVGADRVLDQQQPLREAGLASGDTVTLHPGPGRREPSSAGGSQPTIALVVRSGIDATTGRGLDRGRWSVGRDRRCALPLTDPTVSRVHAIVEVGDDGVVVSPSPEATGPVLVDGVVISGPTVVPPGSAFRVGATTIGPVDGGAWPPPRGGPAPERDGTIPFHRTPYFPVVLRPVELAALGSIPDENEPVRFAYLSVLAPLALGVTMALLVSPRYLFIAFLSPVMAVANWLEHRRRARTRRRRALERHRRLVDRRRGELLDSLASERRDRHRAAPDLAELARRVATLDRGLWTRDRAAPDLLDLRVGLGRCPALVTVRRESRGAEELRDELDADLDRLGTLDDVPVTVDLVGRGVVALVGERADTTALATSLLVQAACLASPEDLVIAAAVAPGPGPGGWAGWLPHTRASASPLGGEHLVTTPAGADDLVRRLVAVAEQRCSGADPRLDRRWPRILVLLDHDLDPDPAAVSRLADLATEAGVSMLWRSSSADRVPRQARVAISCAPPGPGHRSVLADTDPAVTDREVEIDRLSDAAASSIARGLAPLRDITSPEAAAALPRLATLFDALGTDQVDPDWVTARWRSTTARLGLPLGVAATGPLWIDLVADGPHGLLAGTSGAGKSELLTSAIAGLVATNPPDRVNVLFVDYKGGALADQFRSVPHVVGSVTNLDPFLARRALVSLRAELNRRMHLLQGRARDLAEMAARHPDDAPPALVIVVDEFATLVKEIPEFVAGMVDIAQRGRSLGIHLLLATQRPTGAVNDNILANTNLRVALRMIDSSESRSVIGADLAATIPVPLRGRGFVRLGPGQPIAFQAPLASAPVVAAATEPLTVEPLGQDPGDPIGLLAGAAATSGGTVRSSGAQPPSQVDQVAAAIRIAAERAGTEPGRRPWLDELPSSVELGDLRSDIPYGAGSGAVIGLIDHPEGQARHVARFDLTGGGGVAVFGAGGTGKTTALRTLATSAALDDAERGGDGLSIVAFDFASRELTALACLPSCVAVATGDDPETVTRLIALLDGELERRRNDVAIANRQGTDPPTNRPVLVLIDDYGALANSFEGAGAAATAHQWLDALNRVVIDGGQVGISTAFSAGRRSAVKASVLAATATRIVLRQVEPGAYTELGLVASHLAGVTLPPGRGVLPSGNQIQLAVVAAGETAAGSEPADGGVDHRTGGTVGITLSGADASSHRFAARERDAIRDLAAGTDPLPHPGRLLTAPLPTRLDGAMLPPAPQPGTTHPVVPIGLADLSLVPVEVDLGSGPLWVIGGVGSGRTVTLRSMAARLRAAGWPVWLVAPTNGRPARSPLPTGRYRSDPSTLDEVADRLDECRDRQGDPTPVLLIDDADQLDPSSDRVSSRILAADPFLVGATRNQRSYSTNPLLQELRRATTVLQLQPASGRDVQEATGVPIALRPGLAMPPGRGVVVRSGRGTVVQVALPDPEPSADQRAAMLCRAGRR